MGVPNTPQPQAAQESAPAPQSNDEAIGSFARGFLDDLDKRPDPDEPQQQPQEVETQEPTEPEAETPDPVEVPLVEVDIDGEKYQIPEKVKHRVMADKDYRQKTMEVAATRKQMEQFTAKAAQLAQQAQQMAPIHAQLMQMDNRAQYLQQAMQQARNNSDPLAFNEAQGELGILLNQRDNFARGVQQQQGQYTAQLNQLRAQQLSLDAPKLYEAFPDLQKPEVQQQLAKYAMDSGLPDEALDYLNYSAAGVKLVHKARLYDQMVESQAKAQAKLKEQVKTLPSATQSSRVVDQGAKSKQLQADWKKDGGKINSPAFDQLLKQRLRGK